MAEAISLFSAMTSVVTMGLAVKSIRCVVKSVSSVRIFAAFLLAVCASGEAAAQGFSPVEMARKAMAEPFVGLTTDGTPIPGLFEIARSGEDVAAVRDAARDVVAVLSSEQRQALSFPVDSDEWRHWSNFHRFPGRQGILLDDLAGEQREAVFALLRSSLSAAGYKTARDIMRLNAHLAALVGDPRQYGEFKYWLTIFGEPSANAPWGWQFEGHHLIINYFLIGDQLVMTPTFMGSEPVRADSGPHAGTVVLQDEQDRGLAFMRSLSQDARERATIGRKEGRSEALAELFRDNVVVPYAGIGATALNDAQREALMDLVAIYIGKMPQGHAELRMREIRDHLDATYFAWKGDVSDEGVFYYRIQSPVVFIEFDHQGLIALEGPRDRGTRQHIHTVVRTPNGNDYGRDLLAQHLRESHGENPER